MMPAAVLVGAAVVMKGGMFLWVMGMATDPTAEHARTEFLDRADATLEKLKGMGLSPGPQKCAALEADIARLRPLVADGWKWDDLFAASRLANFMVWVRTKGAVSGIANLAGEGLDRLGGVIDKKLSSVDDLFEKTYSQVMDAIFGPAKPPNPDQHR